MHIMHTVHLIYLATSVDYIYVLSQMQMGLISPISI